MEAYRKIRNTCRYLLGNLYDFDPRTTAEATSIQEIDRFALHHLQKLIQKITAAYESFNFHIIFHELNRFCTVDLSAFYLDILKDRLYTSAPGDPGRRAAQFVLYQIVSSLARLMAPILSFTAEEIWQLIPNSPDKAASVHLTDLPVANPKFVDDALASRWENYLEIRDEGLKTLEGSRQAKIIGNSLEAKLIIDATDDPKKQLNGFTGSLKDFFQVSQVEMLEKPLDDMKAGETMPTLFLQVTHADGQKCERCWMWQKDVGQSASYPTLCQRCAEVLTTTGNAT
jgi:isoleucyl-tRNA synthetase